MILPNMSLKPAGALIQLDARFCRVDRFEIFSKGQPCEVGNRSRQFDARRTTANDGEAQRFLPAGQVCSRSAVSNARSNRLRISTASSIVFSPGASFSHSSWPKYA